MTASTVNGSGNGTRSGAQTLAMLAAPLNWQILRALSEGPKQQVTLRRETGAPAQTTLRGQLRKLVEIGAVSRRRRNRFPGVLEFELTPAGRDLLFVAAALESWLAKHAAAPLSLGGDTAKAAVKALVEGWSTTMLRALAARPLSLTELDGIIGSLSYPSLERRLGAMRLAGQVEACATNGRGTPYAVTSWLRRGVAPLAAAGRWEQRHRRRDSPPITTIDVEAAFLLAVPLLRCPEGVSGTCQMTIEVRGGGGQRLAGVTVEVLKGRIAACSTHLRAYPDAKTSGPATAWLAAVIEAATDDLQISGDEPLAHALLDGLHMVLFGNALDADVVISKDRSK